MLTTTADQDQNKDKNKGIKIYFDNQEVGYAYIEYFYNTVHECDEEDCPIQDDTEKEEHSLSSDHIIEDVINRPANDPESIKWPQYQGIKAISFDFKNGFLCYNTFDYEYTPSSEQQKPPTATHMIPVSNIESIDLHRKAGYRDKFFEAKKPKVDRKVLRKHIEK